MFLNRIGETIYIYVFEIKIIGIRRPSSFFDLYFATYEMKHFNDGAFENITFKKIWFFLLIMYHDVQSG